MTITIALAPTGFFLGLQSDYELRAKKREIGADLASIRPMAA